jgi:hypothetical protein
LKKTLEIINSLVEEKIIEKYAIGGSIATLFFIEPTVTYDLDIMIILPKTVHKLDQLRDIYNWAKIKKYKIVAEHIVIEGIPVQFLPAYNELIEEAIKYSKETDFERVKTYVINPEYLISIMIQTNRPIDRERAVRFYENYKELDKKKIKEICKKHNLSDKYNLFIKKYINEK